ncbi:MAG: YihA family ribosome biogenesis GTP-binding protein [Clostridia bacterium]|nr:YihA family ribosome biogenesis GTP-binding protein [Clostridia bacterium]
MNLHNIDITVSAVKKTQYPQTGMPEIAFAGRSNVGKSSFINKMVGRKKLARTSSTPGKTAQINFYNLDKTIFIVDLPGYGYAAVSKQEKQRWGHMMEEYLNTRRQLVQTVLLVDSRHKPTKDDIQMLQWIRHRHGFAVVVATKIDKLSKKQVEENLGLIYETLQLTDDDVLLPFSSQTGEGRQEAWELICDLMDVEMPKLQ